MTTTNNITGDLIKSRANSDKYAENYDAIFKKKTPCNKTSCDKDNCNDDCPCDCHADSKPQ